MARGAPGAGTSALGGVVLVGHNSQIVPTVGLFVGGRTPVWVYTASSDVEVQLAVYPGVQVTVVDADYTTAPPDLPPPPYFVAVDQPEIAARIRAWLPPTVAVFLLGSERALRRRTPGYLRLHATAHELRHQLSSRLTTLRRVDQVQALARRAQAPLILMYGDPDPDGIGAALALQTVLAGAGPTPLVRFTGEVQRYQNKLLLNWLDAGIEPLREAELAAADLVAVVDAQPGFWKSDPPKADIVIDHHPRRDDTDAAYLDLRDGYGATSTILTEYLVESGLPISRRLATALLYGITTDTDDLKRNAGPADIAAYGHLLKRADAAFRARLDKSQIPMSVLDWISWGISHRVVHRDLMVIHFGNIPTADVLVQTADLVLLTHGISWVAVAGVRQDANGRRLVVVFRGDGHLDVGKRARAAFAKLGSAGGHRTMARAEVPLSDQTLDETVDMLVEHLFGRLSPARSRRMRQALMGHLDARRPADPDRYELES